MENIIDKLTNIEDKNPWKNWTLEEKKNYWKYILQYLREKHTYLI